MQLTGRFSEALVYAAQAHATQSRKRRDVPYVSHLLMTAGTVLEAGGGEDVAIAALLHDAAEDQGGLARLDDIRSRFGDHVADLVEACSDSLVEDSSRKEPWAERKRAYLEHLAAAGAEVHLIGVADKLANARSMLLDIDNDGPSAMSSFAGGVDGTLWYYRSVVEILRAGPIKDSPLVVELALATDRLATLLS